MPIFNFSNLPDNNFLYYGNDLNSAITNIVLYKAFMLALIPSSTANAVSLIDINQKLQPFVNQPSGTFVTLGVSRDINRIYCVKSGSALQYTDTDGATPWTASAFSPATAYSLAAFKNIVIVGTNASGYSRSTDYGASFTGGPFGTANVASTFRNSVYTDNARGRIYFCGSNGANFIISYTEDGVSAVSLSLTAAQIGVGISAITVVRNKVYFGTSGGRIYSISTELDIATLTRIDTPSGASPIKDITEINGTAYAVTANGIFKLVGLSFVPLPQVTFNGTNAGNNIVKYKNEIFIPSSSGFITSLKDN